MNPLEEAALDYAGLGWRVLPLVPGGKEPCIKGGHLRATTDAGVIRKWWTRWPKANVAVVCGPYSFEVLDVDGPEGERSLAALEAIHGPLPATREHETPHDGRHILFLPSGLRKSEGAVGLKLDTRGNGDGYVVMPPSIVDGRAYMITRESATLPPAPEWLVAAASSGKRAEGGRHVRCRDKTWAAAMTADSPEEAEAARLRERDEAVRAGLPLAEAERVSGRASNGGLNARNSRVRIRTYWRRVPLKLDMDANFARRSPHAQLIAFRICAGRHSTYIPGVAVGPVADLAAAAHLSVDETKRALRELAVARLLLTDTRKGVYWLKSVHEAVPPWRAEEHRTRVKVLEALIPECRLKNRIADVVSKQFKTESVVWAKRALKVVGSKETRGPLPLPPCSESSENRNRAHAETGGLNG